MNFSKHPRPEILVSLSNLEPTPFWLDNPNHPETLPSLTRSINADLVVVGGGYTGLWTALLAKEKNPSCNVVLLEASEVAWGASGRCGGFVSAMLTHSFKNGLQRWPNELATIIKMGHSNLNEIEKTIKRYNIDCDFIRSGELKVTSKPSEVKFLIEDSVESNHYGEKVKFYNQEEVRAIVNSPTYLAGVLNPANAIVNPAHLAWGLRRACLSLGVQIFERTKATGLENGTSDVVVKTEYGQVRSKKVVLATNAFPPLLKHLKRYIVPVYDYILVSEPLSQEQRASINWKGREGLVDVSNQYHYYHYTADGRILWGGYDAIYNWNNGMGPQFESRPKTFGMLADHFFQIFPQLEGLHFTHGWGGAIDTCSRFTSFWGTEFDGKLSYTLGYTGLGLAASRFGAKVMLDLLDKKKNDRTNLKMVQTKPFPFPPEPLRSLTINATRWSLNRADENDGKRNWWLRLLDALGLGFNS